MSDFELAGKKIGMECPPFIIAEVAQSHDGNLNFAHSFIDAVADAGADAVKFQTHIADAETTGAEPWRVKFSKQDDTRYDYWKRMEFTAHEWRGLADHATKRQLVFLSSPFSLESVELLLDLDMPAWKIASGEVGNIPLLEKVAATGKPVLLSSGMSNWEELDEAVNVVRSMGTPFAVFQCTSAYPCPPQRVGLNVLSELSSRYACPVGISEHSATIFGGLAAVALGARLVEVHVTFHRKMFGPDVPASITFEDLDELVRGSRFIATALDNPVDKRKEAEDLAPLRAIFTKSIVAKVQLRAGETLTADDVTFKKPGTGIPAAALKKIVGQKLTLDVDVNSQLQWSDFE
ncbi:MAG: N-acetylneuraminate synthase [Gammaproteobacteria bacterium]|nr:N-acetylneuraminate synthase [Gammaproteobacteria bacterium]